MVPLEEREGEPPLRRGRGSTSGAVEAEARHFSGLQRGGVPLEAGRVPQATEIGRGGTSSAVEAEARHAPSKGTGAPRS